MSKVTFITGKNPIHSIYFVPPHYILKVRVLRTGGYVGSLSHKYSRDRQVQQAFGRTLDEVLTRFPGAELNARNYKWS